MITCFQDVPFQRLSVPVRAAEGCNALAPTQSLQGKGIGAGSATLPPNVASLPLTASLTTDEPKKSKEDTRTFDDMTFHAFPFQVHAGAVAIGQGHSGCTSRGAGLCTGQAIAGCATPSAGMANGPVGTSTTRPDAGSVASRPLPKTLNGVDPAAFDQSRPFHSHVTALGDRLTAHAGCATAVPPLVLAEGLGSGAIAGIGFAGGMKVVPDPVEPEAVEPEDADPEPPEQTTGPWFDAANWPPTRTTSWLTGS